MNKCDDFEDLKLMNYEFDLVVGASMILIPLSCKDKTLSCNIINNLSFFAA